MLHLAKDPAVLEIGDVLELESVRRLKLDRPEHLDGGVTERAARRGVDLDKGEPHPVRGVRRVHNRTD